MSFFECKQGQFTWNIEYSYTIEPSYTDDFEIHTIHETADGGPCNTEKEAEEEMNEYIEYLRQEHEHFELNFFDTDMRDE